MSDAIPVGICQCGCGQATSIAKSTSTRYGHIAGQPVQFINHHYWRGKQGEQSPRWNGGTSRNVYGYLLIWSPGHPREDPKGYVKEQILVAERALGKYLPPGAIVHHVNEIKVDNSPGNLVICPDRSYHMLLHARLRAYRACGHAAWRQCKYCKSYDDLANLKSMGMGRHGGGYAHAQCRRLYQQQQAKK